MIRVLFVCHGNICRSPMAESILTDLVRRQGLAEQFLISSAATSTEELGNPIDFRAAEALRSHGVHVVPHRAVQLERGDYGKYDYLIGMDQWNISNMLRILNGDPQNKVFRLLDFSEAPRDVADPWYTRRFDAAYDDIRLGCKCFLQTLLQKF